MTSIQYCVQEAEQKQEAERQLDLERKQAEASSEELQRKLEELQKELQERDAQVYTSHNTMSSWVALMLLIHPLQIETLRRKKV